MSSYSKYFKLFDLIDQCWSKNPEDDYWFVWDKSRNLKEIGFCNICQKMLQDNYYDSFYEQVIRHGLDHFPILKSFI